MSTILDASTGEVLAYPLSNRMTRDIATNTIHGLLRQRRVKLHEMAFIHWDHVNHRSCPSYLELQREIDQYIRYYNNFRYQGRRQKMSPVQDRNHLLSVS